MPKGSGQKLKLYYLAKIMLEKTDDEHMMSMAEMITELEEYGVSADRKSLYDDLQALSVLGLDIIGEKIGRGFYYHVGNKHFEIAELKLLVDAIQSSKFITEKKSNELIKKLTSFVSVYEAMQLKRQVMVQGRIKTMNESIYYIVDEIHRAIANNRVIRFRYMKWNTDKEMVPRREGFYRVSPWALIWDDENYYLIAHDEESDSIRHYRVDKMQDIELTDEKRRGRDSFKAFDPASYSRKNFGMYAGEEIRVKLMFKEEIVGVLIDRFGKDIKINKTKEKGWYETYVEVALSDQFFGWIFALGKNIKITGPKSVVNKFKQELEALKKLY